MISLNSSKIVRDSAIKTTPLAKLRRPDTNAATVTQFVDSVENVDDIETDVECSLRRNLDSAGKADIECFVGVVLLSIGKSSAQSVPIESVDGQSPIVPRVGNTGGTGETLIVIEEDPVFPDVSELIRIE